ncbi:MAG: hypothetical protein J2P36_01345 [Ktedonobacteraceae bacterium]|nr:hypothetical protein [Ktedonobacteraceae bacterium]
MIDIAVATCARVPHLDDHDRLLLAALTEQGVHAQPLVWDDPTIDWRSISTATIIRSTWGYYHQHTAFLQWAQRVSQLHALWNPFQVLQWNTHKSYLRDLEHKGIPIVPTVWLPQGTTLHLSSLMGEHGWQKVVIKPTVSAGAYATILATEETVALGQAHLEQYLPNRDMLVQPFLSTVTSVYERSLIFIDGELTHAVKRVPALGLATGEEVALIEPQADEVALALNVLQVLTLPLLYARVDLIRDEEGTVRLMELELVEPDLWLGLVPHVVECFAHAIINKLNDARKAGC